MDKKRVFICGIHQESNSFNPTLTKISDFAAYEIYEGDDVLNPNRQSGVTIAGMLAALEEANMEAFAGVAMRSSPAGPLETNVVNWFLDKTVKALQGTETPDGILVSLHGATLSDTSDDVCGDVLETIRQTVGEDVVISASFDLHANITEKIMKNTDYISGFQTYPHLDLYETGCRAAKRLTEHLQGKKAKVARVVLPMIAPAHGYTTERGGLAKLMHRAEDMVKVGEIIDYSIFQVQPWLDAAEMASTVVITAEKEETAKKAAAVLAKEEFALRHALLGTPLTEIPAVIEKALANKTGKPVVLVDSADSPNAGACADSAAVIAALLPYRETLRCAVAVSDIPAVAKAFEIGVGAVSDFTLGATVAPRLSRPVTVEKATVKSLHDGIFYMYGPQERGQKRNVGKTAVLEVGKILIHVSSFGRNEGDRAFYRSFGIEPELCDLVCVKACTSFRAGYEEIAADICNTNTPGAAGPVLTALPYEKRPRPLFPFEEITEQDISEPQCFRGKMKNK